MAKGKKAAVTRTPIDTSGIVIDKDATIPPIVRTSKYPWDHLVENPTESFFVPFGSMEDAKKSRSGLQSSGRNYFAKRGIDRKVMARVTTREGVPGVRCVALAPIE